MRAKIAQSLLLLTLSLASCSIEVTEPQLSWYSRLVAQDAPAGWWRLNERGGTTVADSGSSGIRGTLPNSGATFGWPGALTGDGSTSTYFDGTQNQILVGTSNSVFDFVQKTMTFTIEAWVKFVDPTAGAVLKTVIGNTGSNAPGFWLQYNPTAGNRYFALALANGSASTGVSTGSLSLTQLSGWCYVAVTGDGTNARMYFNGQLKNTGTVPSLATSDPIVQLAIGNVYTVPVQHHGWIQDVAIYNYPLSAARIETHYSAGTQLYRGTEVR